MRENRLRTKIEVLASLNEKLAEEMGMLKANITESIINLKSEVSAKLDTKADAIPVQEGIKSSITVLASAIDERLTAIDERFTENEHKFEKHSTQLAAKFKSVKDAALLEKTLKERVESICAHVRVLQHDLQEHHGKVAEAAELLDYKFGTVGKRFQTVSASFAEIAHKVNEHDPPWNSFFNLTDLAELRTVSRYHADIVADI